MLKCKGPDSVGQSTGRCCSRSDSFSDTSCVSSVLMNWRERLLARWITHHLGPFAVVGAYQYLHLALEILADAQLVIDNHLLESFESSGELFDPARCALELVGRADVEEDKAIQNLDRLAPRDVLGDELGVARLSAAVAAHVDVPALGGGDQAEVLALSLGTFAHTARDTAFELVRGAQTLVARLELVCEADRITDTVSAPCAAHARLYRAQRFASPYSSATSPITLSPAGGDLTGRQAGNDRVGTVALYVGEIAVVGILRLSLLRVHDPVVVERRQDRANCRTAYLAAKAVGLLSNSLHGRSKVLELLELDDLVELLSSVGKVRAQMVGDLDTCFFQCLVEDALAERETSSAASAALGGGLHFADRADSAVLDTADEIALGHIVTAADLCFVGKIIAFFFALPSWLR
ncbi:hypothetical protein L1887_57905 [Cichorium endivia]|nr:hypothetical protein L1887_57905 [Cichorium endivia]